MPSFSSFTFPRSLLTAQRSNLPLVPSTRPPAFVRTRSAHLPRTGWLNLPARLPPAPLVPPLSDAHPGTTFCRQTTLSYPLGAPQEQDVTDAFDEPQANRKHADDFSIEQPEINSILSPQLKHLFNQSIAINSTAFEDVDAETRDLSYLGWENWKETREATKIVKMIPFSSERKAMGVVVRLNSGQYRLFLKGASEILTKRCTRHVVVSKNADQRQGPDDEIETKAINEFTKDNISRTIIFYANQMLRTFALCYRYFDAWPPPGIPSQSADEVPYEDLSRNMTLVAITGIEDPLRPGVCEAVASCHHAGVTIKMCTGDNVLTARPTATQCGIHTAGGIIMEGPFFRALDPHDRTEVVPRLQVLARSSPEDKKILVETLRSLGEIVGVTGDGTNDGPALKTANVRFSMGIAGTEVAKEDCEYLSVRAASSLTSPRTHPSVHTNMPPLVLFDDSTLLRDRKTDIFPLVSTLALGL